MRWSLKLGKVFDINLTIHWTFLILIGWIFIQYYRQENDPYQALLGVLFIMGIFVCVTLHELGHALTAKRFNISTKGITLFPIGGVAQLEKMPDKPAQELWVAFAGPLVNLGIALVLWILLELFNGIPDSLDVEALEHLDGMGFWFNLFLANIILAVFNLIPAFPMDGGRVLRALLSYRFDRGKATRIAASIGQLMAILFVFLGFLGNIWLIFIGVFIYLGAGGEASFETTRSALEGYKVEDVIMHKYTVLSPDEPLEKVVTYLLDSQEKEFIVMTADQVLGILTMEDLIKGLSAFGAESPVSKVMRKDFLILHPKMNLQEVYQKIMTHKCSVAPVVHEGNLLGIIDKENIRELILINKIGTSLKAQSAISNP
jgi:Zn-dependent protease